MAPHRTSRTAEPKVVAACRSFARLTDARAMNRSARVLTTRPGDMDPVIEPGGPVRRSRSGAAGLSTIRRRDTIKQLDPSSRRF
jgi:hypothetical protein